MNAAYLTVMLEGKYTDAYLRAAGRDAPKFTDEDLKIANAGGISTLRSLGTLAAVTPASIANASTGR
jgi:hypothetical protein